MYGRDRLVSALMRGNRRGTDLLDALLAEVSAFSGSETHQDDVTILTMDLAAA